MLGQTNDLIYRLMRDRERLRLLVDEVARYEFFDFPPSLRSEIELVYQELTHINSKLSELTERQVLELSERLRHVLRQLDHLRVEVVESSSPVQRFRLQSEIDKTTAEIERITANLSRLTELHVQMEIDRAEALLVQGDFEHADHIIRQVLEVDKTNQKAKLLSEVILEAARAAEERQLIENYLTRATDLYETNRWKDALDILEELIARLPDALHPRELRDYILDQVRHAAEARQESLFSLFAVARTELEEEDIAFVGKTYSLQAGIAWERPEGFRGEPFDLFLRSMVKPVTFDILAHPRRNIKLSAEWHKRLRYQPLSPEPQVVEFGFQTIAAGRCSLVVDFYHERRWLRTIPFEFDSVEVRQPEAVST